MCPLCKKKQDLLLKTGKWFHGKETKKHNPTKEIEFHLLTTPSATQNVGAVKNSPKIVKTGFPASSITKAQLVEQAEERRKQQQQQIQLGKAKTGSESSSSRAGSSSSDNSDVGSGLLYKQHGSGSGGNNKKHVTFEQVDSSEAETVSLNNSEINNNDLLSAISDIPVEVDDTSVKVLHF